MSRGTRLIWMVLVLARPLAAEPVHGDGGKIRARAAAPAASAGGFFASDACLFARPAPVAPAPPTIPPAASSTKPPAAPRVAVAAAEEKGEEPPAPEPAAREEEKTAPAGNAPTARGSLPSMICDSPATGHQLVFFGAEHDPSRLILKRHGREIADYHCDEQKESCAEALREYWQRFTGTLMDVVRESLAHPESLGTEPLRCRRM